MTSTLNMNEYDSLSDIDALSGLFDDNVLAPSPAPISTSEQCMICLGTEGPVMNPCVDNTHSSACRVSISHLI